MDISIELEVEDWYRFQTYLQKELPKTVKSWRNSLWFNFVLWAVFGFFFMSVFQNITKVHWPTAVGVSVFFSLIFGLFLLDLARLKKIFAPSDSGVFVGEHQFMFDEEGIKAKGHGYESKQSWSLVQRVVRAKGMIILFLDTAYAYVFPEDKLDDPEQLYTYVCEQHAKNVR